MEIEIKIQRRKSFGLHRGTCEICEQYELIWANRKLQEALFALTEFRVHPGNLLM